MENSQPNATNLLQSLLGEVTEKQKEIYKKIKYEQGDLVVSEVFSDSASSDEDGDKSLSIFPSTELPSSSSNQVVIDFPDTTMIDPEPSTSKQKTNTLKSCELRWDSALPFRYMNGDISFNELTNIMEKTTLELQPSVSTPSTSGNVVIEEDFPRDRLLSESDESEEDEDFSEISSEEETDQSEWNQAAAFEKELVSHSRTSRKKRNERTSSGSEVPVAGIRRKRLAKDLLGLVGQANLHFARGDHEGAIKMCLEVIRLAPTAPEPFQTLGMIYEERREFEKAYQYNLISAYLSPSDGEHWIRVAEMAIDQKQYHQAITCYNKALKIYPDNLSFHIERCKLYTLVDDKKRALEGYEQVLDVLCKETELQASYQEMGLFIAKEISKIHYFNRNIDKAISTMEDNLLRFHGHIINEDVNLYLELLINDKQYVKALRVFRQYCGIQFLLNNEILNSINTNLLMEAADNVMVEVLFTDLQIDLRAKLAICLINLKMLANVDSVISIITKESPNEVGDLFLDIADAYIKIEMMDKAEPLLNSLVHSRSYNIPEIWLRYARCLRSNNKLEESIQAFTKVIQRCPKNTEAKLGLSQLLVKLGRVEEACKASEQLDLTQLSLELLLIRARLLYQQAMYDEFLICAKMLLLSEITFLHHPNELSVMINSTTHKTRIEGLRDLYRDHLVKLGQTEIHKNDEYSYVGDSVPVEDLFDIFRDYCKIFFERKQYGELVKTVLSGYTCLAFTEKEKELDFLALCTCFLTSNQRYCYSLVKAVLFRPNMENNQVWNFFSLIMMRLYQDLRHSKFCLRLFVKNPDNLPLAYINGHNALMCGSYKHALAEYANILKQNPDDPFAAFCTFLGYVHLICQKFLTNRHSVVVQLCAFLNLYLDLRGECQESLYNIGRAFHQIGLVSEATHFYKKALAIQDKITNCSEEEMVFDY